MVSCHLSAFVCVFKMIMLSIVNVCLTLACDTVVKAYCVGTLTVGYACCEYSK